MIGCTTWITIDAQLQQKLGTQFNGRRLWPLHVRCRRKTLTFAISSSDELLQLYVSQSQKQSPFTSIGHITLQSIRCQPFSPPDIAVIPVSRIDLPQAYNMTKLRRIRPYWDFRYRPGQENPRFSTNVLLYLGNKTRYSAVVNRFNVMNLSNQVISYDSDQV